jgi:hypothetical protein
MAARQKDSPKSRIYKVVFVNQGEIWEVYCRRASQSGLFGFIELEDFLFGETTTIVVDPAEERLKRVFAGVERTHIPMHAIVRIDEVARRGAATIHTAPMDKGGNVITFPVPTANPGKPI